MVPGLKGFINAHGYIGRLLVNGSQHRTGIAIETIFGTIIAYLPNGLSYYSRDIHITFGSDLSHDQYQTSGHRGFTTTRASGSRAMMASRIASEILSHILSGCPSVTDSDVKSVLEGIFTAPFLFRVYGWSRDRPDHSMHAMVEQKKTLPMKRLP